MTREDAEQELLRIIQHKTLEEHAATQLAMNILERYTAEKVLEARQNELTKTFTQIIGDKDAPHSRYSKVTRIFNVYLKKRYAELQAELSKLKEEV